MGRFLSLAALVITIANLAPAKMQDLGTFGGSQSWARSASSDGKVVVGASSLFNQTKHAFRWTQKEGMQDLGSPPTYDSFALSCSPNGSEVYGTCTKNQADPLLFLWTKENGMIIIGSIPYKPGFDLPVVDSASSSGEFSGGADTQNLDYNPYRFTQGSDIEFLGLLTGKDYYFGRGFGISSDGQTVVGYSGYRYFDGQSVTTGLDAFKWRGGTMQLLRPFNDSDHNAWALGASKLGDVIVGRGGSQGAAIWNHGNVAEKIQGLSSSDSEATAVSDDGEFIVGNVNVGIAGSAFHYSQQSGVRDLGHLGGGGSRALGISGNGQVVVGSSQTNSGQTHAFRCPMFEITFASMDGPNEIAVHCLTGLTGQGDVSVDIEMDNVKYSRDLGIKSLDNLDPFKLDISKNSLNLPLFDKNEKLKITVSIQTPDGAMWKSETSLRVLLPVVIVPGIDPLDKWPGGGKGSWPALEEYLQKATKDYTAFGDGYSEVEPYPTLLIASLNRNELSLSEGSFDVEFQIDNLALKKTHASKVYLVGHSKGGLIVRQYLANHGTEKVKQAMFVGVPNAGSVWASLDNVAGHHYPNLYPTTPWWRNTIADNFEIPTGYFNQELSDLNSQSLPTGITYTLFYTDSFNHTVNSFTVPHGFVPTIFKTLTFEPGDLVVTYWSQRGVEYDINTRQYHWIPGFQLIGDVVGLSAAHSDEMEDPAFMVQLLIRTATFI